MPLYRGHEYFLEDGLWKVKVDDSIIIVALDDSKINGNRRVIWAKNTEEMCREFIDWLAA